MTYSKDRMGSNKYVFFVVYNTTRQLRIIIILPFLFLVALFFSI